MKKLMIAAAAAAIVGAAQAATPIPVPCVDPTDMCEPAVFKLTASGKLSMNMGSYKTVQSLKVSKGLLVAKRQIGQVCDQEWQTTFTANYTASEGEFIKGLIPVAATNVAGFASFAITPASPSFKVENLAAQYTDIAAAQAGFAGAQADATIDAYDAAGNLIKTTSASKFFTLVAGYPTSLSSIWYSTSGRYVDGECYDTCEDCYDCADIYVNVKAGKANYALKYTDVELLKWSVFGKNFAKFEDAVSQRVAIKYSYKLETEMALRAEDYAGEEIVDAASLYMVAFGNATLKQFATTAGKGLCADGVCQPETSADFKLNGWFVGWYDDFNGMPDEAQYTCDACGGYLYGGTWSATYDAKLSASFTGDADAESYMGKDINDYIE